MTGIWQGQERTSTTQNTNVVWTEQRDTRTIDEDLQNGVITQTFLVPGRPDEALVSAVVGGLNVGDVHPFYKDAYLTNRRFAIHTDKKDATKRRTLVTLVYRRRPCMAWPEISTHVTLVSVPTWFTLDTIPRAINRSQIPTPVLQPQTAISLRWPNVVMSRKNLRILERQVGHTLAMQDWYVSRPQPLEEGGPIEDIKNEKFLLGYEFQMLFFESSNKRLLYGPGNITDDTPANWELVLSFRYDPIREHKLWSALVKGAGLAKWPASIEDLPESHHILTIYPKATEDFEQLLLPITQNPKDCYTRGPVIE